MSSRRKSSQKSQQKLQKSAPKGPSRSSELALGSTSDSAVSSVQNWLVLGQLRAEKCELSEAQVAYAMAHKQAKRSGDLRGVMEALSGLLRLAGEALDEVEIKRWEQELDQLMSEHPRQIPAMAWYCKGAIARHRMEPKVAQRFFHRYLRAIRKDPRQAQYGTLSTAEEAIARGWVMMATMLWQRGKARRAQGLAEALLRTYEDKKLRGVNGMLYLVLGTLAERRKDFELALRWFQKAHAAFLGEHNWYYHLYVLYGYARLARLQQNYSQCYWYLDLIDKAASGQEFGLLRREIATERSRLEQDAVDLLIDSRQCVIRTREGGQISLRKQYVLLHILEALSGAHSRPGEDRERGLSKAEIIEYVWKESYRPEAHDNKLYYNINRLRKLIEPDVRNPQYLLNWKEGYRLAPGLRVHFVGHKSAGLPAGAVVQATGEEGGRHA